jgi:hypothetical protein
MLFTLTLVIFLSSILVFFSEEFIKSFKKIWSIKGVKLFLPLFAVSWIITTYEFWFLWGMFYVYEFFHDTLIFLVKIMPFKYGATSVALVILLTLLSVVPVLIIDFFTRKKTYTPYKYTYVTSAMIWIFGVVILVIL